MTLSTLIYIFTNVKNNIHIFLSISKNSTLLEIENVRLIN